jgi:glycosyltransferase involved in cell wall biosynthesis
MPCRDAEHTVGPAAQSVLRQQGVSDLCLLAVDDGSRDNTLPVLRELAQKDPRVKVVAQERFGLVAALNRGLELVSTPLLARQDADDISHPKRLASQLKLLGRTDVVGCRIRGFPRGQVLGGMRRYESWQNRLCSHQEMREQLWVESPLAHATALMRTQSLKDAGAFRQIDGPEDWDLWARMFSLGLRFEKVPRALYFWREHENRATRTDPRLSEDNFRTLKCNHLLSGPLKGAKQVELWSHGRQGRAWAKLLSGRESFRFSYKDLNPKPVMAGRDALPPFPPKNQGMLLVAYGTESIRRWFADKLVDLGGQSGQNYLLVG